MVFIENGGVDQIDAYRDADTEKLIATVGRN